MPIDLANYEEKVRAAVRLFWGKRTAASSKQAAAGKSDQGERSGVTAGKNMEGFADLIADLVRANGLEKAEIHRKRAVLTLPGFFRPTKLWDLLVVREGVLVAAIELKSHVGPSFGNNFNNRAEEAIGTAHDLWTAYREGTFGEQRSPFIGWVMLVEDAQKSREPVKCESRHFPVFPEFEDASYLKRYDLLCQKLMKEKLYTSAAMLASPRIAAKSGDFSTLSRMTDFKGFVATFAGHLAACASVMNR